MSKKQWFDPKVELPDTTDGDKDGNVARVFVVVKDKVGKKYHCQFRRWKDNNIGAFCGMTFIEKLHDGSGCYFDECIDDSITFYDGKEVNNNTSGINILAWRYDDKLERCKACGHKAKVYKISIPENIYYVVCKKCPNMVKGLSRQEVIQKWNEAHK